MEGQSIEDEGEVWAKEEYQEGPSKRYTLKSEWKRLRATAQLRFTPVARQPFKFKLTMYKKPVNVEYLLKGLFSGRLFMNHLGFV